MERRGLGQGVLSLISLRTGEGRRALLASSYLFVIIASYMALKPVRNSLFIDEFGAMDLPYVTIAYALGAGVFVALYTRLSRHFPAHLLVIGTLVLMISNLLVFWWLGRLGVRWLYPLLYVWVGMFGAIAPAQVWTLVGDLFTLREAKRAFGLIGGGGILGSIAGSSLAAFVSLAAGTLAVLPVVALLLGLAAFLVRLLSRTPSVHTQRGEREQIPTRISQTLRVIMASRHLRAIAALVFLTALATSLIDWQFKAVAGETLSGDRLTAFFSFFFAVSSTLSILVQLFLTGRLIRWIGLGGALLVLPFGLVTGAAALLVQIKLWAATLAKGVEQSLKHSLDRASRELLYLPLSARMKLPVKSAIDMVVDRFGDGTAGVVVLAVIFLATGGHDPARAILIVGMIDLVILAAWIAIALFLRSTYRDQLSRSIAAGRIEISTWSEALAGGEFLTALEEALASPREEVVLEALDLVARNPQWSLDTPLLALLQNPSSEVQARVMSILLLPGESHLPEGLAERFGLEDQQILSECLDILLANESAEKMERIERLLSRAGGSSRGTWIVLLVRRLGPEYTPFAQKLISSLLDASSPPTARSVAAAAIGNMPIATGMHAWLPGLLEDDDLEVAAGAATSVGSIGGSALLERVIPLLAHTAARTAARRALQRRGPESVPLLLRVAKDESCGSALRLRIPSVLAGIGNAEAISGLIELLSTNELALVEAAALALQQLGGVGRGVTPATIVSERLIELAGLFQRFQQEINPLLSYLAKRNTPQALLMHDAIFSRLAHHRQLVFRLLCLLHSPRRIIPAWRGLASEDPRARASAIELIEGLGPHRLGRRLLPLLVPGKSAEVIDSRLKTPREVLQALEREEGGWLGRIAAELNAEGQHAERREDSLSTMSIVDKVIALRRVELFAEIPGEQLARVAALALGVDFDEGEMLCQQDDPPGDLFVLIEGRVRIERDGKKIGEIGAGESIGAWGLFEEEARRASARTLSRVAALRIDRWGFDELLNEHPEITRSFIRHLVQRMRRLA